MEAPGKKKGKPDKNKFWTQYTQQNRPLPTGRAIPSIAENIPGSGGKKRKRGRRNKFFVPPNAATQFSMYHMDFTQDVDELVDDTHSIQSFQTNPQTNLPEETAVKKPFTMQMKQNTDKSVTVKKPTQKQVDQNIQEVDNRDLVNDDKGSTSSDAAKRNEVAEEAKIKLANQELRDCLASDLKIVVNDSIKWKSIQPHIPARDPMRYQSTMYQQYPKGIPRSFLTRDNQTVMEPQQPENATQHNQANPYPYHYQANMDMASAQHPTVGQQSTSTHVGSNAPMSATATQQAYSPTAMYNDSEKDDKEVPEGSESPEWKLGEKRVSAFQRLGPQTQPKKPKLTINLSFNKEEAVREVVDETEPPEHMPVPEREDILSSTDETVMKYLPLWPWTKPMNCRRKARRRASKSAMMMEREQMDETYQRENVFIQVTVTGYPRTWTKEDVLDVLLESVEGKTFIPCFIEFNKEECRFLVIRCRAALLVIHNLEFYIHKDDVGLSVSISLLSLSVVQLDFIPRLVLRKRLKAYNSTENRLDLSAFTLQHDVSHFIYFPLHRPTNQIELMELKSDIIWSYLTELNLSHNKLRSIKDFGLEHVTPRLKHLDLSYNNLEKITILICCRNLALQTLQLEGNPLCHDYTDPARYVKVVRMMFSELTELDGLPINLKGDLPAPHRNYCPEDAAPVIDSFMQVFFPLLDSRSDDRLNVLDLYADDAVITITYSNKLGSGSDYRFTRGLLFKSRVLLDGDMEQVDGLTNIQKLVKRWPNFEHDPLTFTVDVLYHCETSTIFRVGGILKILADSLADNEHLVAFSRTFHLHTTDDFEYKIENEMVYWAQPTGEYANSAFKYTAVKKKSLGLKFESPPDYTSKKRLLEIFMKLTELEQELSEKCLTLKDWDLKEALEHFVKLHKNNNVQSLLESI